MKIRLSYRFRPFLLCLFGLALSSVPVSAQCNWDGVLRAYNCPANVNGGTNNNGAAVKATIEGARFGEVIKLGAGIFTITSEITLSAASGGVVIEGQGRNATTLQFTAGGHGLIINAPSVSIRNLAVTRTNFDHTGTGGGIVTAGESMVLENLSIYRWKEAIWLGGNNWSARIKGCWLFGNQTGIGLGAVASNNLVVDGNHFYGNSYFGIQLHQGNFAFSIQIANNVFSQNGRSAIFLSNGRMITIANNLFERNEWQNQSPNEAPSQDSHISIWEPSNTTHPIRNLIIRDNLFHSAHNSVAVNWNGVQTHTTKWSGSSSTLKPWRFMNASNGGTLGTPNAGYFSHSGNLYTNFQGLGSDSYVCGNSSSCF